MEVAGIFLNFSQSCQNKMFSSLTSDLKKACGKTHTSVWTHAAHLVRGSSSTLTFTVPELYWNHFHSMHMCAECVSPWSSILQWSPPTIFQMRQPSSVRWLSHPLRLESQEGWSYCLHSPVQTYSTLHTSRHKHTHLAAQRGMIKNETESETFSCHAWTCPFLRNVSCTAWQCARWLFMLTSIWHCLALWGKRERERGWR